MVGPEPCGEQALCETSACGDQGLNVSVWRQEERCQEWVLHACAQPKAAVETEAKGMRRMWEGQQGRRSCDVLCKPVGLGLRVDVEPNLKTLWAKRGWVLQEGCCERAWGEQAGAVTHPAY